MIDKPAFQDILAANPAIAVEISTLLVGAARGAHPGRGRPHRAASTSLGARRARRTTSSAASAPTSACSADPAARDGRRGRSRLGGAAARGHAAGACGRCSSATASDRVLLVSLLRRAVPLPVAGADGLHPALVGRASASSPRSCSARARRARWGCASWDRSCWRDLADVAASPRVAAAVKIRAEAILKDQLADLRLGEKITLAKIATLPVLVPLLADPDAQGRGGRPHQPAPARGGRAHRSCAPTRPAARCWKRWWPPRSWRERYGAAPRHRPPPADAAGPRPRPAHAPSPPKDLAPHRRDWRPRAARPLRSQARAPCASAADPADASGTV